MSVFTGIVFLGFIGFAVYAMLNYQGPDRY